MKIYRGIIFDLFATLALWHHQRLPEFTWNGKTVPSTMGELQHTVRDIVTEASFEEFYTAFQAVNEAHAEVRATSRREIPSRARFAETLHRLGYEDSPATDAIAETLSLSHMDLLLSVVEIPRAYKRCLESLGRDYVLGLVSNFDHGPTARRVLERDGVHDMFDEIVISDGHGWRKPHPSIFSDTLASLGLDAQHALFVGDSLEDDVAGARGVGMDVAWVNAKDKSLPADAPQPTFVISTITELGELLPSRDGS